MHQFQELEAQGSNNKQQPKLIQRPLMCRTAAQTMQH